MSITDNWPFIGVAQNYTVAYDYDSSGNLIYQGWVQPGAAKSETGWRIMHQVFNASNKLTDVVWPQQSTAFNFIWNLRTTYDYGLGPGAAVYTAIILTSPNTTRWAITVNTVGDLITTPTAAGPSGAYDIGSLVLEDSTSVFWDVTVTNIGDLVTTAGGSATNALSSISISDSSGRAWVLTVIPAGNLVTT